LDAGVEAGRVQARPPALSLRREARIAPPDRCPRDRGQATVLTMPTERTPLLDGMVRVLELDCFRDARGSLTPVTFHGARVTVARAFVVSAPQGMVRGGHAHRRVRQVLFRASGAIDVHVSHRGENATIRRDEECPAVLVEAGVWAQQVY